MPSQAWSRFKHAMSSFASQCPLFGVCHRAFTSLTSAARRSGEPSPTPDATEATIEAMSAKKAATPVILTNSDFSRLVERSKGVTLVDFWAPWCMPCRRVSPTIERLAREFDGRATVGKLNIDENMAIARRYGISGIPTVGVFRNGKLVNQLVGIQSEQTYRKAVESALAQVAATATSATTSAGAKTTKTAKTAKASARP